MELDKLYKQFSINELFGRYITLSMIEPILKKILNESELQVVGKSVLGTPIYRFNLGTGKNKILLWSQMHGNESTTTKALIDFLYFLKSNTPEANEILTQFTFFGFPMLNPDGALLYTRENANKIDLNRDFKDLSQPESSLLQAAFIEIQPHFCFNLHDQRTIFGLAETGLPATVSFLAPSYNIQKEYNEVRLKAVSLIIKMNNELQKHIPNQIGRFDDSFNINCVGDSFQNQGVPTILIEAGHFPNDYEREETRKMIFISLFSVFTNLNEIDLVGDELDDYLNIPQNKVIFYDFVCKNIKISYDNNKKIINFAAQFREELIDNQVCFNSYIVKIDDIDDFKGHLEIDALGLDYIDSNGNLPILGARTDFNIGNKFKIKNGKLIN